MQQQEIRRLQKISQPKPAPKPPQPSPEEIKDAQIKTIFTEALELKVSNHVQEYYGMTDEQIK
jgi:hypothetical protein